MDITFYSAAGSPVAYTEDSTHIFSFDGTSVAYLDGGSVYSYAGRHLGWFEKGWVRDHHGHCVFFTERATGGPARPMSSANPVKGLKAIKPIKRARQIRPIRLGRTTSWSPLSGPAFFEKRSLIF